MKRTYVISYTYLFLLSLFILSEPCRADGPPPPPPGGAHGGTGNQPPGGGAPIGEGMVFLFLLVTSYGAKRIFYASRKYKREKVDGAIFDSLIDEHV
jgi:hypothetical protein